MSLQGKIKKLEDQLQLITHRGLDIPDELAENLNVFERVADQMLEMIDEVLAAAPVVPKQETKPALGAIDRGKPKARISDFIPNLVSDRAEDPAPDILVLLVEDNIVNRKLAVLILEKVGCQVDIAVNGQEGVEKFKAGNYLAIFMDCQMPVMDGYDATRAIREHEAPGSRIPIIAVTANAMKGDREKCLECGMDDYISKPIMPTDLHEAVSRWCKAAV